MFLGPLFFSLEMNERISQLLGASQRRQKVDPKAAGSAVVWNMAANQSKKVVLYGTWLA